jgi:hypothetical protein
LNKEDVMFNRRRLARERLEIYLVHLLLAFRPLILISGLLLLAYVFVTVFVYPFAGYVVLVPSVYLILLGSSYNIALYTARLGAWIGTIGRHDD